MNVFISQPMHGMTTEVLKDRRLHIVPVIKKFFLAKPWVLRCEAPKTENDITILDNLWTDDLPHRLQYLGKSIALMSQADVVVFVGGWVHSLGCKVEFQVAKEYGIQSFVYDLFMKEVIS